MENTPKLTRKRTVSTRNNPKGKQLFSPSTWDAVGGASLFNYENTPPCKRRTARLWSFNDSLSGSPGEHERSFSPILDLASPEVGWTWCDATSKRSRNLAGYKSTINGCSSPVIRKHDLLRMQRAQTLQKIKSRCEELDRQSTGTPKVSERRQPAVKLDALDDFFNDSADDFLLLASQQVETQTSNDDDVTVVERKSSPRVQTPTQDKNHSSFYLRFLEEDTPDDWLTALDAAVKEATQSRTPLKRYNSMPTSTLTKTRRDVVISPKDKPKPNGHTLKRHRTTCAEPVAS